MRMASDDCVGTCLDRHLAFLHLHFKESLGCRETARNGSYMHGFVGEGLLHEGCEIREDADGGRKRIVGTVIHEGIDLPDKFCDGSDRVLRTEGREIHQGHAVLEDGRTCHAVDVGGDGVKPLDYLLLVRSIAILF